MNLPTTTARFIFYFVRQQWIKFSILIFTSLVWAINDTFFPYFLKRIVNTLENYRGAPEHIYAALSGILLLLVLFWLITEALLRVQGILQIYTFPPFRASIRETVFNYVKQHSYEFFSSNFAGNIAKKLGDLPTSCQTLMEIICFQYVTAVTGAIIVIIMMWSTKPIFAIIVMTWLCLHLGITALFMRFSNQHWEIHSDAVSVLSGKIVDVFTNILNVRLFAHSHYETQHLRQYQHDEIQKAKKAMWVVELMRIGLGLSGLFLIFGMIFTLIHGWIHHWVTLGDFTQIGMQTFWLLGWIWYVSFQMTIFSRELGTISEALSLVKKRHDIIDIEGAKSLVVKHGEIAFKNVCFGYGKHQVVFKHLNVVIPPGKKIGLVGYSGSGKSTFVNLILRFYDLQSGAILLDGQNIAQVRQDSLRDKIAMIPQEPALFHRSLFENIRYGRLNATNEEIITASKLAHCHEFIEKLDEGYESLVGERGIKLSGGQRQRIAIARAILKNAPILILDEATSSLDTATEKIIQNSMHHLMQGRTTIVIAHRLSTLTDMDKILVFRKGEIIEEGTKEELLKIKGHFATLWNMQTDGFLPESA